VHVCRYNDLDGDGGDAEAQREETGWKLVHGGVCVW